MKYIVEILICGILLLRLFRILKLQKRWGLSEYSVIPGIHRWKLEINSYIESHRFSTTIFNLWETITSTGISERAGPVLPTPYNELGAGPYADGVAAS
jgi:hypothetical protein